MVDTIIVGQYLGSKALAAVGSTGCIMFLVLGFANGIAQGFGVMASHKAHWLPGAIQEYGAYLLPESRRRGEPGELRQRPRGGKRPRFQGSGAQEPKHKCGYPVLA